MATAGETDQPGHQIEELLEPPSGHGPMHHHRSSGLVSRVSMGLVDSSIARPKRVVTITLLLTVAFAAMFVRLRVDTNPENMLPADADVRVLNSEIRETFGTGDMIVVGIFATDTMVTPERLGAAVALHDQLETLTGVDEATMISVRTAVDGAAPADAADAESLADRIASDPLLGSNVLSEDEDTLAFFIPLETKSDAQPVADEVDRLLDTSPSSPTSSVE